MGKELSLSELRRFGAWTILLQKQEHRDGYPERDFISWVQIHTVSPLSLGDSSTLYRSLPIIWTLHLLIIQTPTWAPIPLDTLISSLWVALANVALFRGLLFINAVRRVVVMHLMWWWQPLLRYFGFSSFLRIWRVDYSGLDAPLIWILQCPRRNYSSDMFSLPPWA